VRTVTTQGIAVGAGGGAAAPVADPAPAPIIVVAPANYIGREEAFVVEGMVLGGDLVDIMLIVVLASKHCASANFTRPSRSASSLLLD
jgi:hypothetical protein